jgi:hypothetical protein
MNLAIIVQLKAIDKNQALKAKKTRLCPHPLEHEPLVVRTPILPVIICTTFHSEAISYRPPLIGEDNPSQQCG